MPPKVKITKEDIIKTSIELIRNNGKNALNARAIAAALDCSTQPIFSSFSTMEALDTALIAAAYERYLTFLDNEIKSEKYPPYKAFGMAYIRFAKEEKELFKFLFMRDRTNADTTPSPDFEESVQLIMRSNDISYEKATLMHLEMWCCVHGIGTMLATSFLELDRELVSRILSDVYQGVKDRILSEENK